MGTAKPNHTCALCGSRGWGIFCNLSADDLRDTDSARAMAHYESGQRLIREGSPATNIYCIHRGLVKLTRRETSGTQVTWRLLGPGDVVGYRDVLADRPYSAGAETIAPSQICAVPRAVFERTVYRTPQLALELLSSLARELHRQEQHPAPGGVEPVRRRAARLLVQLWEATESENEARTLTAALLRNEMSQIIGTTPETFSRTLKVLAASGAIEFGRRSLTVINPDVLKRIASGEENGR